MFGSLRAYSTNALGHIVTKGSIVSVLAPLPKNQLELFAQLKQNDRKAAFEKVKSAILYNQLSAHNRGLVFKANRASTLESRDEPSYFDMTLGTRTERVELKPRKYLGPPSKQDLRVLVTTSHTPEEVSDAIAYVQECLKSKELGRNFAPELGSFVLKRAATAGNFQSIYHEMTTQLRPFKPVLNNDFYAEALRIYALRVPYLSHRSKSMLNRLYKKTNAGIGRELAYVYGLSQYKNKFGEEKMGNLPKTLENIKELLPPVLERPRASLKNITQVDLVMAYEGLKACGLPGSESLADSFAEILQNVSRHRPLTAALTINLADRGLDGETEFANTESETNESS